MALLERGLELATAHEYNGWAVYMRVLRARVLVETGRWNAADQQIQEAMADMRTHGWAKQQAFRSVAGSPHGAVTPVRGRISTRRGGVP
jgi:hypothetical protein